jgi:hypothetical protein
MPASNFFMIKKSFPMIKNKFLRILAATVLVVASCKKDKFVELNTNPGVLDNVSPEEQFTNGIIRIHEERFEWYYDNYRRIMPWVQLSTATNGNGKTFTQEAGNFNTRLGIFYPSVGAILTDVEKLIEKMPQEEQQKREFEKSIARILKIYYAFYVSDINGSIPYAEAFQGKYGGTFTPKYESQQELFDIWDQELKSIVTTLSSTPSVPQVSFGGSDLYYGGDVQKWMRTAHSLRLKIAMRLMKRDPSKLAAIANEIVGASDKLIKEGEDWMLVNAANFTEAGDWSPVGFRAPKPTVDFMWDNQDPRIRFFYQPNWYSKEYFDSAVLQGKIAGGSYNPRRFVGSFTSPDAASLSTNSKFYTTRKIKKFDAKQNRLVDITLDTLSNIQPRLFQASFNGGTGKNYFPLLTYADVTLMRAELAARGITSENEEELYYEGIEASISLYEQMANDALIQDAEGNLNFQSLMAGEISAYENMPAIKYDPAKAVEQITIQEYINYFKQPNEAWALIKRTGMPNNTTMLALEKLMADGTEQQIPRRAALGIPTKADLNYQNITEALNAMAQDPGFGAGPTDFYGRVWWDK